MHLAAFQFHRKAVTEFVQGFEKREGEPEDHQVFRSQNAVRNVLGQLRPVHPHLEYRPTDHQNPQDKACPAEERPRQPLKAGQNAFRIDQGKTHEQGASQILFPFAETPLLKAFQELCRIGHYVRLKGVHRV